MNEQQVNELIAALREQTIAQKEQTTAINSLADSNVALRDVIVQLLTEDEDTDITTIDGSKLQYLSQKARG